MYERFTDRARKVMQLAHQEALRFNQEYIRPEHLLIGIAKEGGGVAVNALSRLGIDARRVRLAVEKVAECKPAAIVIGRLPFCATMSKAIAGAVEESQAAGCSYVGTEHLLMGVALSGDPVVASVMADLGITHPMMIRAAVIAVASPAVDGGPTRGMYHHAVTIWSDDLT